MGVSGLGLVWRGGVEGVEWGGVGGGLGGRLATLLWSLCPTSVMACSQVGFRNMRKVWLGSLTMRFHYHRLLFASLCILLGIVALHTAIFARGRP